MSREPSLLSRALWWALAAWAGEHAVLLFLRIVRHRPEAWLVEYVWLGLIGYVLVFACVGLVAQRLVRTEQGARIADGVFAGLAAVWGLLVFGWLAGLAVVLMGLGFGVRIATLSTRAKHLLQVVIRSTMPPLAAGAAVAFVVAVTWYPLQERRARAKLPAAPANAPNIILLVLDTVRASDMSVYGFERPTTPGFEAFARGGARFDRAMSTAPWTLASHLSMFSGVFPHKMAKQIEAIPGRALDPSYPVLAQVLANHGYLTGAFSANLSYITREWGFDRGFVHFESFPLTVGSLVMSTAAGRAVALNQTWRRWLQVDEVMVRKKVDDINARLVRWASQHGERPFFAFANYFDAHEPALPPEPFRSRFVRTPSQMKYIYLPFSTRRVTQVPKDPKEYAAQRDLYDGAIATQDHEIGLMLQEMSRRGLLDNTIVIITSDHGEMFGEHGRLGHGVVLYQSLVNVPLLISYPGHLPAGTVVAEPVTLADLPATILDLAGIDRGGIPGNSLQRYWAKEDPGPPTPIVSEDPRFFAPSQSIVVGHYQYISHPKRGPAELYDIDADPVQLHDLAGDPRFLAVRNQLSAALDAALAGSR